MSNHRNITVSVPVALFDAVYAAAKREGLVGAATFARRAIQRDLGAFTEEAGALREYDALEIEIPQGPLARFALLAFPQMEQHEWAGCARCRAFLCSLSTELVMSTDEFALLPEDEQCDGGVLKRLERSETKETP